MPERHLDRGPDASYRRRLVALVDAIDPHDELERAQQETVRSWLRSGVPLCRTEAPDTPDPHLVSYVVVLDEARLELLLVAHRKAGLWLPPGGHVDVGEDPWHTVVRECQEELGVRAVPSTVSGTRPYFLTMTRTRGERSHTDVSLWYVLGLPRASIGSYDREEFDAVRWVPLGAVAGEPVDTLDPHLHRFAAKLLATTGREHMSTPADRPEASIREITVADREAGPYGIASGPDGALWLTMVHAGQVARLGLDGQVDRYPLDPDTGGPSVIAAGPDGALWFTESRGHRIGRVTVDGKVSAYDLPTPDSGPFGLTAGPDGALWFTQLNAHQIGRITVDGTVREFALPVEGAMPSMIASGADGALWFTLNQANAIGRMTVQGEVTVYALPTPGAGPVGITSGPDGALWFVEILAGQLGRITLDGTIDEFPLPDTEARPHAVVTDPRGACWFSEWGANRIGCRTPDGRFSAYDLPSPSSEPHGITLGPDGAVWAALEIGSVARLEIH